MKSRLFGAVCACALTLGIITSANAALVSRLGGLAYYDTDANLTWLANANAAGDMNWADANAWAGNLIVGGVDGWRLPDTIDVGNNGATYINVYEGVDFGYNITTHSEMSNMWYNVLGNTARYDTSGNPTGCPSSCLTNTTPFSNLQSLSYWSASEYAPDTNSAWQFDTTNGSQGFADKANVYYAWAVQSGDVGVAVSTAPVPAAAWLFGSGLIGLVGVARRKKA